MTRISLASCLIAGGRFRYLPAVVVAGPRAIESSTAAVLPLWCFCRRILYRFLIAPVSGKTLQGMGKQEL